MKFDETDLMKFFGIAPVKENPEEKEFFGSSHFVLVEGELTLNISFSTHAPMVMADLYRSKDEEDPCLCVEIQTAETVRIDEDLHRLTVLDKSEREEGSDPELKEVMSISLNPLKIFVFK